MRKGASLLGASAIGGKGRGAERDSGGRRPGVQLVEPGVQSGHQQGDLVALGFAQRAEELGRWRMTVLARLELEDAIARPQLEVEGERPQEVLERLVGALIVSQFPK